MMTYTRAYPDAVPTLDGPWEPQARFTLIFLREAQPEYVKVKADHIRIRVGNGQAVYHIERIDKDAGIVDGKLVYSELT